MARKKKGAVRVLVTVLGAILLLATVSLAMFWTTKKTNTGLQNYEFPDINTCYYNDFSRDYSKAEFLEMVREASRRVWYFGGACLINVSVDPSDPIKLEDVWNKAKEGQDTLITLSYNDCTWMDIDAIKTGGNPIDPEYSNDGTNPIVIWKSNSVEDCQWNFFDPVEIAAGFTNILSVSVGTQAKNTLMITSPELYCGLNEGCGAGTCAKRIPGNNVAAYGLSMGRYNNDRICRGDLALPLPGGEKDKAGLQSIAGYCKDYLQPGWWGLFWNLLSTGLAGPGVSLFVAWDEKLKEGSDPADNIIACTGYYYNTSLSGSDVFGLKTVGYTTDPDECNYKGFDPSNWISSASPGKKCMYVVVEDGYKRKLVKNGQELDRAIGGWNKPYRIEFFILTDPSQEGVDSSDMVVLIRPRE